jgi:hypothetical protein
MTKLRPECSSSHEAAIPNDTALYLILDSVAHRKELIFGKLGDNHGGYCAIGAFWADHPGASLCSSLIDEVALVNDSVPQSATPRERWKKVNSWLRWKIRVLAGSGDPRKAK